MFSDIRRLRAARADELATLVAIDDEASALYAQAGIRFALDSCHPFVAAEASRWADAIARGRAIVAVGKRDQPIGFIAMGEVDGEAYVDQLSVRPGCMRQGVGTALLLEAIVGCGGGPLWLTTYAHLPWNRPFYERHGFVVVADEDCGSRLVAVLKDQRAALPAPEQRIAMVRRPSGRFLAA